MKKLWLIFIAIFVFSCTATTFSRSKASYVV